MTIVYLAAVVIGAPLVAYYVFAGFESVPAGSEGFSFDDLLSVRSLAFLVAFFGVAGLVMTGLGLGAFGTLVGAVVVGGTAAWLNALLIGLVRSTDGEGDLTVEMIEGRPAEVVVPIGVEGTGRVTVEVEGRQLELVAASLEGRAFAVGDHVVVVQLGRRAAYVAPIDD